MENQKSVLWFRVLALCLALGLGGVFVWSRQKPPIPQVEKPPERELMSGSKSTTGIITTAPLTIELEKRDRVLMPGSKSGRVVMPGSKSAIVVPALEQTKDRTVMPGSKSIVMPIFEKRKVDPAAPTEPAAEKP